MTPPIGKLRRRDFLCAGTLALGGLGLPHFLRAEEMSGKRKSHASSAIVILLDGGPSHIDTFDPKPEAPSEIRGEFGTISTRTPGVQLSEHLPKLAGVSQQFALLRGVSHTLADHGLGKQYVLTGTRPLASLRYPEYASVVAKLKGSDDELPSSVAIPKELQGPGFLGMQNGAFETGGHPRRRSPLAMPSLTLPAGMSGSDLERRDQLRRSLDQQLTSSHRSRELLDGMDRYYERAYNILASPRTREALDLSKESPAFANQFRGDAFSQSCLLAIRLVEAGVRCVTLSLGGWDTHEDNFHRLKNSLLPQLDAGLSALYLGLQQRGLHQETQVLVTGEFGRTPKVNDKPRPGRDHYARCMCVLMSGGRIAGGQVAGASDAKGTGPAHTPITPDDVAATFYANLGIDPQKIFQSADGRPITLVRDGRVIKGILG